MVFTPFLPCKPVSCEKLPLTLISLEDWTLVNVIGPDSEKYLQSQFTSDVTQMNEYQHLLSAHCDPNGKMWSNLHLFRYNEGFAFIERFSVRDVQLIELKKYAIFSKVKFITETDLILLGVAGFQARAALNSIFSELPTVEKQVVNDGATILLWFKYPKERFLLVTNIITIKHVIEKLRREAHFNNSQQWLSLNIEAGIPIIDAANSRKFIPQATNLHELGGISFKKGCYIGQEIIARAKFRGTNKLAMWYLSGIAGRVPIAGENLELKIGGNWRRTGTVLAAVQLNNNCLLVQAVINNNIELSSVFRVCGDVNTLHIKPLPYLLR